MEGATYIISHTKVAPSLSEPQAFLREAPVCNKLIPKVVPIQPKNSINVEKMPNEHGIIPKFSTILLFGLICLCKKN